jgi:hypothetical protein
MASIIICDGCLKHAPHNHYLYGWIKLILQVYKGYARNEMCVYEFHVCSQQCFNAVIRLKSVEVFE